MDILVKIAQLLLSLSILIVLHELGHFIPARLFKTRVEKFYLFFDPWISLFKKKIGETEYGIGWIPLGGYVKISGMIDESMDKEQMKGPPQPWEFRSKPAWQRLIIMLGGVTVNFILGFLIFAMLLFVWGESYLPNKEVKFGIATSETARMLGLQDGDRLVSIGDKPFDAFNEGLIIKEVMIHNADHIRVIRDNQESDIALPPNSIDLLTAHARTKEPLITPRMPFVAKQVVANSPAEKAGIQKDDAFLLFNDNPINYYHLAVAQFREHPEKESTITVKRGLDTLTLSITPSKEGTIGVAGVGADQYMKFESRKYGLFEALPAGVTKGWQFLVTQLKAFGQMFSGKIKTSDSLGGFITIGNMFPGQWDWEVFWRMTAILSLILAFMNLLPIPALDGGHVLFLLWEVITGRKVSDKVMEYATITGFIIVIGLVLYANGLDILRLFGK